MNLTRNYSSFDNIENACWKVVYNCRRPPPLPVLVYAAAAEKICSNGVAHGNFHMLCLF